MSDKITPAVLVQTGKKGEKYISSNGNTVEIVSVKGDAATEIRYKRSFPKGCKGIDKLLFLELFKFKTFTMLDAKASSEEVAKP